MDLLTSASVPSLLKKILTLASRPLVEFKKYEVLDLVEALMHTSHDTKHDKANYFRLVYETLRGKLDQPDAQFCALLLPLLGDKDYEKVLDVVVKTEKRTARANNYHRTRSLNDGLHIVSIRAAVSFVDDWVIFKRTAGCDNGVDPLSEGDVRLQHQVNNKLNREHRVKKLQFVATCVFGGAIYFNYG